MSKAFLRESDFDEPPELPSTASPLPPGTRNLLTPTGAQRLRSELARLVDHDRPPLVAQPDDPDAKRELLVLDQRIRHLRESLQTAEIVPPPPAGDRVVRFGATVTVRERDGTDEHYRLVGVDEAEPERGSVSWLSPLARALLNAREGDLVKFATPSGMRELTIVRVGYEQSG